MLEKREEQLEETVDLEAWVGSRAAARCSAAAAQWLRAIRTRKLYREEFCKQRVGIDRSNADAIIRRLEEFGPAYFRLAAIVRMSPQRFRLIASFVREQGLEYNGELIPFEAAQVSRLAAAVKDLAVRQAGAADPARRLRRAQTALKSALTSLETVSSLPMDLLDRQSLHATFEHAMEKLGRLSCIVPH
jgi:hypothetical protein